MLGRKCISNLRCTRLPYRFAFHAGSHVASCRRVESTIATKHPEPHPVVAIVGSGPAGFYTAQKLMRELPATKIDVYEQLPVPFGLVRFGVAPDHPEVKNCEESFTEVAQSPNFTFVGNINLGKDIPLQLLARHYDAVVFAYGASQDRKLGLEGEEKQNIYSARAFVGWYNGLPEYRDLNPDLSAGETAVIIGQGNVALDVARTLLTDVDTLRKTDITDYALEALSTSKIKHVNVVGRRGPLQAAFTIKEVRELMQLENVNFHPISKDLFPQDLKSLPRPKRRLLELLQKTSINKPGSQKSWSLDFLLSPTGLDFSGDQLQAVIFKRNQLSDPLSPQSGIKTLDQETIIPASTLFRSIGYKAISIPGMSEVGIVFDERSGTIQHDGYGRAYDSGRDVNHPTGAAHVYCSGWVKRGPTGVIASTMTDAFETAEAIVEDWKTKFGADSGRFSRRGWRGVKEEIEVAGIQVRPVHWDGWDIIDAAEKQDGARRGKPREKIGRVEDMLSALSI